MGAVMTGQCDRSRVRSSVKTKDFIECPSDLWRVLEPRSLGFDGDLHKEAVDANLCELETQAVFRCFINLALCPSRNRRSQILEERSQ